MNIVSALHDPKVFGHHFQGSTWAAWRVFLTALFGLELTPIQLAVFQRFTGRAAPPTKPLQEAWLVVRRRGGKSFVLAVIAVFLACFRDWRPYLGPGEVGTVMIIAKDRAQARSIKNFISGLLHDTPLLRRVIKEETAESIRLRNRIVVEIHTASYRSTRGYTIIAALLDEVAIWESDERSAEPDAEVINAIKPGMATIPGAMLLCASSPHDTSGGSADSFTLSISHVEADANGVRRVVLDAVRETRPPFNPDAVVAEYAALLKRYGIFKVIGDRYGGQWPRERFAAHGIKYVTADKTASDFYSELLPVLNGARAELLDHGRLIAQLCSLERSVAGGGKVRVEHAPGGHDDLINAAAVSMVSAIAMPVYRPRDVFGVFVAGIPRDFPNPGGAATPW